MDKPIVDGILFNYLIGIVCATLLIGWIYFFRVIRKNSENVRDVLAGGAFLQNLTVIGVVASACVLAAAGVIKGELVATLLSGIVGYVLGSIKDSAPK